MYQNITFCLLFVLSSLTSLCTSENLAKDAFSVNIPYDNACKISLQKGIHTSSFMEISFAEKQNIISFYQKLYYGIRSQKCNAKVKDLKLKSREVFSVTGSLLEATGAIDIQGKYVDLCYSIFSGQNIQMSSENTKLDVFFIKTKTPVIFHNLGEGLFSSVVIYPQRETNLTLQLDGEMKYLFNPEKESENNPLFIIGSEKIIFNIK